MGKKIIQIREGDKGLFLSLDKGVRFLRAVYIKRQFAQPRHDSRDPSPRPNSKEGVADKQPLL